MNLVNEISKLLSSESVGEKFVGVALIFVIIIAVLAIFTMVYLTTRYVVELVKSRKPREVQVKNNQPAKPKLTKEQKKQIKVQKKVAALKETLKKFGVHI